MPRWALYLASQPGAAGQLSSCEAEPFNDSVQRAAFCERVIVRSHSIHKRRLIRLKQGMSVFFPNLQRRAAAEAGAAAFSELLLSSKSGSRPFVFWSIIRDRLCRSGFG